MKNLKEETLKQFDTQELEDRFEMKGWLKEPTLYLDMDKYLDTDY